LYFGGAIQKITEDEVVTNSMARHNKSNGLLIYISMIRQDIKSALERDPAARSSFEILMLYPGLHAVWVHRITHWLWIHQAKLIARWISQLARGITGIEIHPGATIGSGLFIDHGMGVVVGETAEIGNDVTLYHGVTLGGTNLSKGKRHPTIKDRVTIGAGAKVLGNIVIGADSRIGANAVVVKSVPENSVVVGVPGQIVRRSHPHLASDAPDLNHSSLPDIIGVTLKELMQRVDELENELKGHSVESHPHIHLPKPEDSWEGVDFEI
jgi:serine O-acetyltransferase